MCLEAYLAVSLLADGILLGSVSRALGLFNHRRVLAAASLCAMYGVLAAARPRPFASTAVQLLVLCAATALIIGPATRCQGVCAALSLGASALVGGTLAMRLSLSGPWASLPGAAFGGLLSLAVFAMHPPCASDYTVNVCLAIDGRRARFPALVDTGNRLREPVSGLPVLIAEANLLKGRLPKHGYRTLRYGAVGGSGCMPCFRPAAVWIERGLCRRRVPDVWVAVASRPLPGLFRALAPSVFSLYML